MGPQATIDFLHKLVVATPVVHEQDHLRVLVDSNAGVPDRNSAIAGAGPSPGPALAAMARGLQQSGADFLVMACNTAHAFAPAIRAAAQVPFISIIEEACDACVRDWPGCTDVGVLAAPGCLEAQLFQRALGARNRKALTLAPPEQERFNSLLYRIKLGGALGDMRSEMRRLADTLVSAGAGSIIAGCTEVPLVLAGSDVSVPLLDATDNLARRCVLYARQLEPLPR